MDNQRVSTDGLESFHESTVDSYGVFMEFPWSFHGWS